MQSEDGAEPVATLSNDTTAAVEQRQLDRWREMSSMDKAALLTSLCTTTTELAEAGIRLRHPGASEHERFLRYAILTLGRDLACAAYPDAALYIAQR